jgi:imidazolonepropionase
MSTILIRGARQLLTLRGPKGPRRGPELNELGIIADGALLIRDGVLIEVGPTRRVENLERARGAVEISAAGRVVMPGFVDSHTHLLYPLPSGPEGAEGARLVRAMTGQRLEVRARAWLEAMARHGTTTVEIKTGAGPDESAETKLLRVMAAFKRGALEVIPTFLLRLPPGGDRAEWVLADLLPTIRKRRLARFADLAWDPAPALHECFGRYLELARSLGLGCKVHAAGECPGAVALAVERSAASVDHLERATPADIAILAGCPTVATLLPCASFHDGGPYAPARALVDAGAAVALASNYNPRHTPALNMQTAVALACRQMGLTPAEAISAATVNGAHAVNCAARTGSIEPGKSADLLILNISDYRELGRQVGANVVHMTMKRGECIYEEAEVAPRAVEDVRLAW